MMDGERHADEQDAGRARPSDRPRWWAREIGAESPTMALTASSGNNGSSSRGPSPLPPVVSTPANATTRYAAAVRESRPQRCRIVVPSRQRAQPAPQPVATEVAAETARTRDTDCTRCRPASHLGAVTSSHTSTAAKHEDRPSATRSRPTDARQRSLIRSATARPAATAAMSQSCAVAEQPVLDHGAIPLAKRERLQHRDVGVRRVGDVQRRLDEVDGVPKVRRRRAAETTTPRSPPRGRAGSARRRRAAARARASRLAVPPERDEHARHEEHDLVATAMRAHAERAGRLTQRRRTGRRDRTAHAKAAVPTRHARRVLPPADGVKPERAPEAERDRRTAVPYGAGDAAAQRSSVDRSRRQSRGATRPREAGHARPQRPEAPPRPVKRSPASNRPSP